MINTREMERPLIICMVACVVALGVLVCRGDLYFAVGCIVLAVLSLGSAVAGLGEAIETAQKNQAGIEPIEEARK